MNQFPNYQTAPAHLPTRLHVYSDKPQNHANYKKTQSRPVSRTSGIFSGTIFRIGFNWECCWWSAHVEPFNIQNSINHSSIQCDIDSSVQMFKSDLFSVLSVGNRYKSNPACGPTSRNVWTISRLIQLVNKVSINYKRMFQSE